MDLAGPARRRPLLNPMPCLVGADQRVRPSVEHAVLRATPVALWSKPPGLPCRRSRRQSHTILNATRVPTPSSPHDCTLHFKPPLQGGACRQACHAGGHAGRATPSRAVRESNRHPARTPPRSTSTRRRPKWSMPPGLPCRRSRRQSHRILNATGVPMPSSPHDCALHFKPPLQGGASRQACHVGGHAGRATQSCTLRESQRHPARTPPRSTSTRPLYPHLRVLRVLCGLLFPCPPCRVRCGAGFPAGLGPFTHRPLPNPMPRCVIFIHHDE